MVRDMTSNPGEHTRIFSLPFSKGSHDSDGKWGGMVKSHVEDTGSV